MTARGYSLLPAALVTVLLLGLLTGCRSTGASPATSAHAVPRYALEADRVWQMNSPHGERFDASGLYWTHDHRLLTVSDRGATPYEVLLPEQGTNAILRPLTNAFTTAQLAPFAAEKYDRYDCEGITEDKQGRIYLCEEANRWILRWDPLTEKVERLGIDWSPVKKYFDATDRNASFEGIAIHGNTLYVANERKRGRIIEVNLDTLRVTADFTAQVPGHEAYDVHYSDLCWFDGFLYALLRESWHIVKIDPATRRTVAVYAYREMEQKPDLVYRNRYPTSTLEGLAVDKDYFWLCTDNNGRERYNHPGDIRPTLFRCPRPDK